MNTEQTAIAPRSQKKLHFDHKDMDYYFSWVVGRKIYDGSDEEECFATAARIVDGDAQSWQAEWQRLAEEVKAEAERALRSGDRERARNAYLRACTYFRAPLFIMSPKNPRFEPNWRTMRACFRQAAELFDPPIEQIQVPFRGTLLDGYFWTVDDDGEQRPTLLVIGGLETFAEDCYFMVGPSGPEHGYNVLTVDLPGQGTTPYEGLYLEARMEISMETAVDYALTRAEIDPARLAVFGFSWGGHIVLKGAEHDSRIRALIANPAMPDVFRAAWAQQSNHSRGDPVGRVAFDQIAWRFGLKLSLNPGDILQRIVKAYQYLRYGRTKVGRIECPTLCMAGEGEPDITLQLARTTYEQLPNPLSKLVIFTEEEGGEAHCQVDNLALPNGTMFTWLADVFDREEDAAFTTSATG